MIAWLYPAALVGLLAIAGPVLVHLLRRERARRIVVPTVRFMRPGEQAAVRLRMPSDGWLLLLRATIVACVALAAARPLLLTDARRAQWSDRVARAVVVDASESARAGSDVAQIATASAGASPSVRIDDTDLARGIGRAAAWLAQAPPARREIVIVSDFQRGALSDADVDTVPDEVGLRFLPSPTARAPLEPSLSILDRNGVVAATAIPSLESTAVTYNRVPTPDGLEIMAAGEAESVATLRRVVAAAGATAPSPDQPIVIRFPGADAAASSEGAADWAVAAGARLLAAPEVAGVDLEVTAAGNTLVVDANVEPDSLEAALVVKAALDARDHRRRFDEAEPARIADARLAGWSRPAAPADPGAWRQTDESDGRWFWMLALALLGLEAVVRRPARQAARTEEQHAA